MPNIDNTLKDLFQRYTNKIKEKYDYKINASYNHSQSAHAPSNAEENQNAFSKVKVGDTTIAADSKTDTLEVVAGENVTITPDATNDKITISSKDTTYSPATQSSNGLMSSTDKTKLDGIETGANKTVVDSTLSTSSTNPVQNSVISQAIDTTSKTETGSIVSISDAANVNAESVKVAVEPVQDLHGYDKPWVGGAGKNKLYIAPATYDYDGVHFVVNNNGTVNISGQLSQGNYGWACAYNQFLKSGTYKLNGGENNGIIVLYLTDMNDNYISSVEGLVENEFNLSQDTNIIFRIFVYEGNTYNDVTCYPMIRLATETDSTFEPYTNICPISGRSEVNVDRVGKNILPITVANLKQGNTVGTWSGNTYTLYGISFQVKTDSEGNVTSIECNGSSSGYAGLALVPDGSVYHTLDYWGLVSGTSYVLSGTTPEQAQHSDLMLNGEISNIIDTGDGITVSVSNNKYYPEIRFNPNVTISNYVFYPMIRRSIDSSSFESYQANTYTIQLGDTIYGGTLNVSSGELRVDRGYVEFDGSSDENWLSDHSGYRVVIRISTIKTIQKLISNEFKTITPYETYVGISGISYDDGNLFIGTNKSTSDFKTWLQTNLLQVAYELANPYTIKLTPQQIKLLQSNNTLYADAGDITVQYQPDNVIGDVIKKIENEYDARFNRLEQYTDIFGFVEDMDVLSPTERIKYIGKNENYEPLFVDLSTGRYTLGDWGDFPVIKDNQPYMVKPDGTPDYQLNEWDYNKKIDGTDSDITDTSYDGGAFSWIRKIYKKSYMIGNKRYVLFSLDKKDGFSADGFINPNGVELTGRWLPMYYGTVVNGVAKSIATGNCITGGNLTTDAQHNAITAFHANAKFFGGSFVETLIDLLMMFAKTSDLQAAYGYGNSSGYVNNSNKNYGMLDNTVVGGGQFYGTSGGKAINKIFHSMVLGTYNSWMRNPYEVIKNGEVMISKDYTYDPTGATYTDTGIAVPNQSSDNWRYTPKYIAVPGYGSIPDISVTGASTALGRADGTYTLANQSGSVTVCRRFGDCAHGSIGGVSARTWDYTASVTWWDSGFALLLDGSVVA